jgi:hypothetical protein
MLDLEEHSVTAWLLGTCSGRSSDHWPPTVRPLERAADNPGRLAILGERFETLGQEGRTVLSMALHDKPFRETLRSLMVQLGSARTLRVLHWVGQSQLPGLDQILAELLDDETPDGRALHAAVAAITRSALLAAIFDPARIAALAAATAAARADIAQ